MFVANHCLLSKNTQVEVKSNSLRAEGMIAIAEALKVNSTVTKIDVSDNEIGGWYKYGTWGDLTATPEGPAALAEALKVNTTVQWVHAWGNKIPVELLTSIMNSNESIANFGGATSLNLSNIGMDSNDGTVLSALLSHKVTVTEVRVRIMLCFSCVFARFSLRFLKNCHACLHGFPMSVFAKLT